ncbi:MAG: AmmeMemoRadiSam system protein B, partial [Elusimicrobia bacterium]|nr:AmmeMemoRadiSam system protein B [Elusimicrobiota bacterium]MBD3412240.1 AmmeMemoRadiSam system protein B [Elusimicrobiota bacterium]
MNTATRTLGLCTLICALTISSCSAEKVREPSVAGQWYPDDPDHLAQMVDSLLSKAQRYNLYGIPVGFIVPHAGYVFSGHVAASAFKQLEEQDIDTVVIIGLAHRYPLDGASVYAEGVFRTPLGDIPVNESLCKKLMAAS